MNTDIRDLILDNDGEDMNKTAEQENISDTSEYIKLAEQLEALSEDDNLRDDLIKVAIFQEYLEFLSNEEGAEDEQ